MSPHFQEILDGDRKIEEMRREPFYPDPPLVEPDLQAMVCGRCRNPISHAYSPARHSRALVCMVPNCPQFGHFFAT